ncbi:conserved hypothetical protein [Uncinocarpus reesii 1704]|uniref:Uncharacterized protein n=1 Tax=Uncinocarpus reesii (strain UAMH 1704) TaxID=336963 RepID=C4JRS1_UNCRE|nr:uncharacterized protein UREG_05160 [Uncinocarpus reesii 1704]EEP80318.1 conserved hypothetical protein [Uncinocarpus reesii 1704]
MSPVNSLWFKWKSLKLPWRRFFLIGQDLAGNTFWEFRDSNTAGRLRRIVKYNPKTHYADVKVSPQWHQWLRYVRPEPPSIIEQQQELVRQEQIKHLARLADERWANKRSYLDKPQEQQPGPAIDSQTPAYHTGPKPTAEQAGVRSAIGSESELGEQGKTKKKRTKISPWEKSAGAPGEKWQPEAWTPSATKR